MSPIAVLFTVIAGLAGVAVAIFLVIYLVVPLIKAIGWLIKHLFKFIFGIISDALRFVGAVLLAVMYVFLILGNIVIARWSASGHYGRQFMHECSTMGLCLYRIAIGHPLRLLCLGGVVEGVEKRLPAAIAAAPTADLPASGRAGQFEGYRIVGSLAPGGSGAKLYIAEVDSAKRQQLARLGVTDIDQVVIKSFSLKEGSSLPQIVRESRSLDAAKKLGLILDHELAPERFHYVMRYVPGESLSGMTKSLHAGSPQGGLGDSQLRSALSYCSDLVATLAAYHRGGLWHKDVKPDNLIIDENGRAHLVDFGLVSSLRSAMTLTTHGTEYFRDPEMVRLALKGVKVHEVDGTKFDIYGAGAVLYSVIEDSFPAHGALSQVTRRSPESVKWIIRRAMTDYDKRYVSAEAMLADIEAVRTAKDPFAVRPADLPSMRGNFGPIAGDDEAPRAAATPMPEVAGIGMAAPAVAAAAAGVGTPPPLRAEHAAGRTAPVIEVTDWWSGKSRVVGSKPYRAPTPEEMGRAAKDWARDSVRAANDAMRGMWAGVAAASTPRAQGAPRRSAADQLAAARARVEARRTRAGRGPIPGRPQGTGFNAGVAAALFIFVGALVGVIALVASESNEGARLSQRIEAAVDGGADRVASRIERANGREARVHPAALPVQAKGRVLVVSDVLQPWEELAADRITELTGMLEGSGLTLVGNTPDGPRGDGILDTIASVRLALGQVPLDDPGAPERLREWLGSHGDEADAVVWIAPSADKTNPTPRVFAFVGDNCEDAESVDLAIHTAIAGR